MSRYIDADALTKEIKQDIIDDGLTERYVFYRINEAPSIDIVRCKECKHNPKGIGWVSCPMTGTNTRKPDDFCSYGCREEELYVETD